MILISPELTPLCRYIRECIVIALGGGAKEWHTDEQIDEFIAQINGHIVNLLHDLIVMLDYLMVLKRTNASLDNEESEIVSTARKLIVEVWIYLLKS